MQGWLDAATSALDLLSTRNIRYHLRAFRCGSGKHRYGCRESGKVLNSGYQPYCAINEPRTSKKSHLPVPTVVPFELCRTSCRCHHIRTRSILCFQPACSVIVERHSTHFDRWLANMALPPPYEDSPLSEGRGSVTEDDEAEPARYISMWFTARQLAEAKCMALSRTFSR